MCKCLFCYKDLKEGQRDFHPECARKFFGTEEDATPKDTAAVVATSDDGDGADVSQQSSDATSDVTGKSSGKEHHGSATEQAAKEDKTSKSTKKSSSSSSASNE